MREHRSFAAPGRLWRLAVLTAAGVGATTQADAAFDYFSGQFFYPNPYWQDRPVQRPKPRRRSIVKEVPVEKDTGAKPHGPLIIAISIEHQKLKIYDSNGFFAESPVSTGMKGHPTPMGVFSVIQKHKFHHSNIYSGAPMPYMQRITWSGVAIHAGVLPGYPASHGCIRMPMAFAIRMWNWTKMGARVIVTPGELAPEAFSHPLLASFKVPPQPTTAAEPETNAQVASKSDKSSPEANIPETRIEDADNAVALKPSLGHHELATPTSDRAMPREQTRTADAGADARPQPLMLSDAASNAPERPENAPVGSGNAAKNADGAKPTSQTEAAESKPDVPAAAKPAETADARKDQGREGDKPTAASAGPADATRKSDPAATAAAEAQPEGTSPDKDQTRLSDSSKPLTSSAAPADAAKKSDVTPTASVDTPPAAKDIRKDDNRPSAGDKPAATKPEAPKRAGQIAVFISRKDSKLYVRQNFSPLFEAPVTIAASDRPLGTHVFTAEVDKDNANALHWSVVSLPVGVRHAQRGDEDMRPARLRRAKVAAAPEAKPTPIPDSPAEALDRLTVAADTMARINEMLTSGGSIVVSDQGINQGESGEGTDFIVRLR